MVLLLSVWKWKMTVALSSSALPGAVEPLRDGPQPAWSTLHVTLAMVRVGPGLLEPDSASSRLMDAMKCLCRQTATWACMTFPPRPQPLYGIRKQRSLLWIPVSPCAPFIFMIRSEILPVWSSMVACREQAAAQRLRLTPQPLARAPLYL